MTVTTVYVGANAELVRGFITTPLERVIAAADGIDYIESTSSQGVSLIRARLRLNYESTKALAEISSKVDQVRGDLPPEAQVPVLNIESADSQFAAAYLSFSSEFLKQNEITDYLVRVVQPRLTAVEGVQRADLLGARTFAMRIWLKPDRMAALNVSPAQVRQALAANNYLAAVGQTKGSLVQVNLTTNTDLRSVDEFRRLIVRQSGGAVVRLSDVADVVLGAEDYDSAVAFSGQTAVFVGVWALPNANSLDVIKRVRVEMTQLQKELPEQIKAVIAYDATEYIQSAINEVVKTLGETLVIVVIVIFLFLGSFRSVLVPVVAIPVSLIGAVFLMQLFGFTVNLLTLLAIVLSVGLVVDDAIVVVENVERHISEGLKPIQAALTGARELVMPIIAMTITLAAVYSPIAFQGGLTGSLFREFALTLAGAVTISGVVALTLSPVMSGYLLKPGDDERGLAKYITHTFARLRTAYGRGLEFVLARRGIVYLAWGVFTVLAVLMFMNSPKELRATRGPGRHLWHRQHAGQLDPRPARDLRQGHQQDGDGDTGDAIHLPNHESRRRVLGRRFEALGAAKEHRGASPERGATKNQRHPRHSDVWALAARRSRAVEPSPSRWWSPPPPRPPRCSTSPPSFRRGRPRAGNSTLPPILDVKIDQPQSEVIIDREKVAQLGLNLQTVGQDLGAAVGGNFVNRFSISGRSYKVIPQLLRVDRLNPEQLNDIYVTGPAGG